MRLVLVFLCIALSVLAHAGDNPYVNIFIEFLDTGTNFIDPPTWTSLVANVYLETFGTGGGVTELEFMLDRSFSGSVVSYVSLMDGPSLGDPESGWVLSGSCLMPDGNGRVLVAQVEYFYDGYQPGTLEVADHPSGARGIWDCSSGMDSWCVRSSPSGHARVGIGTIPPGDCPESDPCLTVTSDVNCDIAIVGHEVNYTICVDNYSLDTDLYNITVVDDVLGDVSSYFSGTLVPGEMECWVVPYTVPEVYPGPITNTVTATGYDAYGTAVVAYASEDLNLIYPGVEVWQYCISEPVLPEEEAEFLVDIHNVGDCDLLISTDDPQIPPFGIVPGYSYAWEVTEPVPGGVFEICNELNVTATLPPEYCDIPAEYLDYSEICCAVDFPEAPLLLGVTDVGNDQGRNVRLRWLRSRYDAPGQTPLIESYEVYRRQDEWLASDSGRPADISGADVGTDRGETRLDGWDYVAAVSAHGESVCQFIAPTHCDSTVAEGMCWSTFFVRATTSDPHVFFDSAVDSGYSVDNLAPAPPGGLLADGDEVLVALMWDAIEEEDFDYYAVYRGVVEDFEPGEPIGFTSGLTFDDDDPPPASEWWYKITAFDFSGNESEPSLPAGASATGVSDLEPTRFWLGPAVPNPFNPVTDIQYWVPSDQAARQVTLVVHDSAGRVIRHLVDDVISPGAHFATWDGRDDEGSLVASGVYYYSMKSGEFEDLRKMTLLK